MKSIFAELQSCSRAKRPRSLNYFWPSVYGLLIQIYTIPERTSGSNVALSRAEFAAEVFFLFCAVRKIQLRSWLFWSLLGTALIDWLAEHTLKCYCSTTQLGPMSNFGDGSDESVQPLASNIWQGLTLCCSTPVFRFLSCPDHLVIKYENLYQKWFCFVSFSSWYFFTSSYHNRTTIGQLADGMDGILRYNFVLGSSQTVYTDWQPDSKKFRPKDGR